MVTRKWKEWYEKLARLGSWIYCTAFVDVACMHGDDMDIHVYSRVPSMHFSVRSPYGLLIFSLSCCVLDQNQTPSNRIHLAASLCEHTYFNAQKCKKESLKRVIAHTSTFSCPFSWPIWWSKAWEFSRVWRDQTITNGFSGFCPILLG